MSSPLLGSSGLPESTVNIQYNGSDVSAIIQPNKLRVVYHDRISYQSDNLEFSIADPDGIFRNQFTFAAGGTIQFGLSSSNFGYPGESLSNTYGRFSITRVTFAQGGSGTTVDIRCSSVPIASSFRLEMNFRRWLASRLHTITDQIAGFNQMSVSYLASTDPLTAEIEQTDESDFVFLSRLCQTYGMSLKIKDNTIIVFSRSEFEAKPPVGTITFPPSKSSLISLSQIMAGAGRNASYGVNGKGGIVSWSASDNLDGIFKDAHWVIMSPDSGKTTIGTFVDPNTPAVGASLNKRGNVYEPSYPSPQPLGFYDGPGLMTDAATLRARYELRLRAEKRHTLQITLPLCLRIESGAVWTMSGIGPDFDGGWINIETEHQKGGSGSQTGTTFERVLGW